LSSKPPESDRSLSAPPRATSALLDRAAERQVIEDLVSAVEGGLGRAMVLHGDAGMGKTRLLEHAVDFAPNLRSVWISGVEAERDLGFAALHRLLRPFLTRRSQLPGPQRDALGSAFGLQTDMPADRFMVGLACLTLLADVATEQRLICVIDDAQWIDKESLAVLAFVARRLSADGMGLFFGVRDSKSAPEELGGLLTIPVAGLPGDAALELLSTKTSADVDAELARRIMAETSGCPLALIELASELTEEQLRGGLTVSDPLPIGQRLEEHFLRQVRSLDETAQLFLLVAAAETSGDASLVRRVAGELGSDRSAEGVAVASGLVKTDRGIVFRHPLIRSAIYGGARVDVRKDVHGALAANIDPTANPDRRAHHLAAAADGPDEDLAKELEQAANQAAQRGGYSAESAFLLHAAQLTPDPQRHLERRLSAAAAALSAGLPHRAKSLLDQTRPKLKDPLLRAEAMRLEGHASFHIDLPSTVPTRFLAAARAFAPLDRGRARETLLETLDFALVAQDFLVDTSLTEITEVVLATPNKGPHKSTLADLLLDAMATLLGSGYAAAVPLLRQVADYLRSDSLAPTDGSSRPNLGVTVTNELWDYETEEIWVRRLENNAREKGALLTLRAALLALAWWESRAGRLDIAEAHYDEVVEVDSAMGFRGLRAETMRWLKCDLYAWRGREVETIQTATALAKAAEAMGVSNFAQIAQRALATLAVSAGRYSDALEAVRPSIETKAPGFVNRAFVIGVEAGIRAEDRDMAEHCMSQLEERATVARTPWALGQLARCRALCSAGDEAERFYLEAVTHLKQTSVATDLFHTNLLYGEWLRRANRRQDARTELRIAFEAFSAMGAEGFAKRAQVELEATGETVRRRSVETQSDMTPQEAQVARLAAEGATNAEIAAKLFISANTVDYHLRKVFRKLGISSRRQLASTQFGTSGSTR
jgi:DNA-binding CsgD family transcriptional regulator/tetratricopeptide (TPR) repeat protein